MGMKYPINLCELLLRLSQDTPGISAQQEISETVIEIVLRT